ncbi:rRNA maturation RNase YbeY [Candidatus Roizmanbacteria bacterium CG_4_10_14_0_8_um_filter_39_9]|uniref:rRNA maturation RNase YbeY n=1 Tax=Candidatus Roizmanbacteria bacterium CG_4_10_14_0_8_um_filter_39_9 TaxID=1974829 RepID=A0A2M7QCP6_9BACT|nr:MAG: rRNA maturation RNase YbeY [Candidatus Roizmanbacteria bacterium CG_4_10_14_0_8_um_filter_39_9]
MNIVHIVTSSRYKINRKQIRAFVVDMMTKAQVPSEYQVNCIFVGKTKMRQISSKYKKEDVALPVLSFPYDNDKTSQLNLLGEIFLCYPQIILLAAERNKRVEDMILAMVKHGLENLLIR